MIKTSKINYFRNKFHRVTIDSDNEIADAFNYYFVNIGTRLASKLPLCNTAFILNLFLITDVHAFFFLSPITEEEIVDILNKLPHGKAHGRL